MVVKILKTTDELIAYRDTLEGQVGFVPTMGALHSGHLSLIERSVMGNDHTIVSIFVNPTQFLAGEDLDKYPRKDEADIKICSIAKVDALFMPNPNDIYLSDDEIIIKAPKIFGYTLEGYFRPTHFDGVVRVVLKLLNLANPNRAYFGKKDAQQLAVIQKMVRELFMRVEIIPCDIVRDTNGLALSSRNVYLTPPQIEQALLISKSLKRASKDVMSGITDTDTIKDKILSTINVLRVEYVAIVDREFNTLEKIEVGNTIILIAAYVGTTRLIDNIWI
jgi:pantoate--beta-alanine ligase